MQNRKIKISKFTKSFLKPKLKNIKNIIKMELNFVKYVNYGYVMNV